MAGMCTTPGWHVALLRTREALEAKTLAPYCLSPPHRVNHLCTCRHGGVSRTRSCQAPCPHVLEREREARATAVSGGRVGMAIIPDASLSSSATRANSYASFTCVKMFVAPVSRTIVARLALLGWPVGRECIHATRRLRHLAASSIADGLVSWRLSRQPRRRPASPVVNLSGHAYAVVGTTLDVRTELGPHPIRSRSRLLRRQTGAIERKASAASRIGWLHRFKDGWGPQEGCQKGVSS